MFKGNKNYNKDFQIVDEKTRYKLYKSGKNWVKASTSQLELFRSGGGEIVTSSVENDDLRQEGSKLAGFAKLGGGTISL